MSIKNYQIIRRQEKQKDYPRLFGWPLHNLTAGKYFLQKQDKISERPYLINIGSP